MNFKKIMLELKFSESEISLITKKTNDILKSNPNLAIEEAELKAIKKYHSETKEELENILSQVDGKLNSS